MEPICPARGENEPVVTVGLILASRPDNNYANQFPPLGLGYIAASVRKELPGVRVVLREELSDLLEEKPDLVGISAQSETYAVAIRYARTIKEKRPVPVVIGGVHISMLPESLDGNFDVAVLGEGEAAFVELLRSFIEHGGLRRDALMEIPGLFFRMEGGFHRTPPRPLAADLDLLPKPVMEELPFYVESPTACIVSSRGCPYHCTFCISEKFARRYRCLSAEKVADDIEDLVRNRGARHIVFYDDLLIANRKRLGSLISLLRERKLLDRITCSCAVRANLVSEEICRLLRELNVTSVGMGVESFSDRILKYYNKSGITGETNQRAIDLLHSFGITPNPSIILAAPIETREDMLVTLRKVFENLRDGKIGGPTWSTLIPYPGTKIWDYASGKGIVGPGMDWDNYASTLLKMYLCEELPLKEFGELMNEWLVKCTLLLRDRPERGGTFVIRDERDFLEKFGSVHPVVSARKRKEVGDDLILDFGRSLRERSAAAASSGVDARYAVSIVIPVYNRVELTVQCLEALSANTEGIEYEVVLVDNASSDGTAEFLKGLGGDVRVIRNNANLGFAKACNQGARAARGKYILFLNNDTIPLAGWLSPLVEELETDARTVAAGARLLYEDGTVQHAGVAYSRDSREPFHPYRNLPSDDPRVNRRRELQGVTAACMLVRPEAFRAGGGFNEEYRNGYEDLELCLKMRRRGGVIVYQPRSVLYHLESQTDGRMSCDDENKMKFMAKWSGSLLSDEDSYYLADGYKMTSRITRQSRVMKLARIRSSREWEAWKTVADLQRLAAEDDRKGVVALLERIDRWPEDPGALRFGGTAARWADRADLAAEFCSRALALEDDPHLRAMYINALLALKRTDLAGRELGKLSETAGDYHGTFMIEGLLRLERADFKGAGKAFGQAAMSGAEPRDALFGEMLAASGGGDDDALWDAARGMLSVDPGNRDAVSHVLRVGKTPERVGELRDLLTGYLAVRSDDHKVRREYRRYA